MLLWSIEPKIDWNRLLPTIESKNLVTIMGDDTTPGRGLMEMIPPEACMDKPSGLDCAKVDK